MAQTKMTKSSAKGKRRGRPRLVEPHDVVQSADTYGRWLRQYWPKLGHRLLTAQSGKEVTQAVQQGAPDVVASLAPLSGLMLAIVQERRFPRVRSEAQIQFLADSMGGQGIITPRRSREICAKERNKVEHFILRREYYIECSCGYKGPALNDCCPDCGTGKLSQDCSLKEDGS
jgi:hypothetical protein